jgi:mono/diheme cytochrome c family protein
MSPLGRACVFGAAILGLVTATFWDSGTEPVSSDARGDGSELFHAKGCASCHDGPDSSASVGGLPSLVDATEWAAQRRPPMTAEVYLAESIAEPNAFISPAFAIGNGPATGMPDLELTADEIDALIEYLLSK